jgi:hypothetical protein
MSTSSSKALRWTGVVLGALLVLILVVLSFPVPQLHIGYGHVS